MKKLAVTVLLAWLASFGLAVAQTATLLHAQSATLGVSLLVEANPQHVLSAFGCNTITGGTTGFCIAYNGAAVPGTGSLTAANVIDVCQFAAATGCTFNRIPLGVQYPAGIAILLSSAVTPFTYTTGTETGFIWADYN